MNAGGSSRSSFKTKDDGDSGFDRDSCDQQHSTRIKVQAQAQQKQSHEHKHEREQKHKLSFAHKRKHQLAHEREQECKHKNEHKRFSINTSAYDD